MTLSNPVVNFSTSNSLDNLVRVSKSRPCRHCGKTDWCYYFRHTDTLECCPRIGGEKNAQPAPGWKLTTVADKEGYLYVREDKPWAAEQKKIKPEQIRYFEYPDRQGNPLLRVARKDDGLGGKKITQQHWNGKRWVNGGTDRNLIPIYRYAEIREAIVGARSVYIVEGEDCADTLWSLGLAATTNIGGAGKWKDSDTKDLDGAKTIILCPDRDQPGIRHMEAIAKDFPGCRWLYAYPDSPLWENVPASQGVDVADWVTDYDLTQDRIKAAIVDRIFFDKPKKGKGTFMDICERIKAIRMLPCPGEQEWELQSLAKESGRSYSAMMKAYYSALNTQPVFELSSCAQVLGSTPERFDWVIPGLLPTSTTALLYAEGGTGKTLFSYDIIKAVVSGNSWNGFPVKQGKVFLLQTDEPSIVTAQSLKVAGFAEMANLNQLMISFNWQFTQTRQLRESIAAQRPVLVVVDSLTSSNRSAEAEEKDIEYARCLYEFRDMAMEFGCAFLILHHENKSGGVRGSTAIKANVSEVWHLKKDSKLAATQRLLEVEKSRSGCSQIVQLNLDIDNYSWQHQGDYNPARDKDDLGINPNIPLKARLLNFLQEHPGVPCEPEELASRFGGGQEAIRKSLDRLWRAGLVQSEERTKSTSKGDRKYKVYLVSELSRNPRMAETLADTGESFVDNIPGHSWTEIVVQEFVQESNPCPEPVPVPGQNIPEIEAQKPEFRVGDQVATSDPYSAQYIFHGTIEAIFLGSARVRWEERAGKPGSQTDTYELSQLRHI